MEKFGNYPIKYTIVLKNAGCKYGSMEAQKYGDILRRIYGFTIFYPNYLDLKGCKRLEESLPEIKVNNRVVIDASDLSEEEFDNFKFFQEKETNKDESGVYRDEENDDYFIWDIRPEIDKWQWGGGELHHIDIPIDLTIKERIIVVCKIIESMDFWYPV
jgi:hypothetical protein